MSLREMQSLFWRAITWPTGAENFLRDADEDTRRAFADTFAESGAFGRCERVEVYADGYFWRLHDVLAAEFPVARWLVGEGPFRNLVTDYVLACPSVDPDLGQFARRLATFVSEHALADEVPPVVDVVRVERAMTEVLVASDADVLSRADLAAVALPAWPSARFGLAPGVALVDTRWDFGPVWQAHRGGDSAAEVSRLLEPGSHARLVWRGPDLSVYHRSLVGPERRALTALVQGATFAEICGAAAGPDDACEPDVVAAALRRWVDDGILAREAGVGRRAPTPD